MDSLYMSLDDMIKSRKINEKGDRGQAQPRHGRGRGGPSRGGRPFGAPRRNVLGVNTRPSSFTIAKNGLFEESVKVAGLLGTEAGTKLHISNLDVGVSNEDIRELFSEIGKLILYAVHYVKRGIPSGSAEVIFARRNDAFQALRRYNNVQLDGRPMKIEILSANVQAPVSARINVLRANGKMTTFAIRSAPGSGRGGFMVTNRGSGLTGQGGNIQARGRGIGGGHGRGGCRLMKKTTEKSAEVLDKELDSYHSKATQR